MQKESQGITKHYRCLTSQENSIYLLNAAIKFGQKIQTVFGLCKASVYLLVLQKPTKVIMWYRAASGAFFTLKL